MNLREWCIHTAALYRMRDPRVVYDDGYNTEPRALCLYIQSRGRVPGVDFEPLKRAIKGHEVATGRFRLRPACGVP
jgi:hypothetical protein